MNFSYLSDYFLKIEQETSRLKITQLLAELYKAISAKEAQIVTYLSLGTLRAQYENNQFNFAQKNLEKVLSNILNIELQDYKKYVKEMGDLGLAVAKSNWPFADAGLTIEEVYNKLCALQEISGLGSQEEKSKVLVDLLMQTDAISASYIVRILVGNMRLGFSDMTIVDALSWLIANNKSQHNPIENAYNVCTDLGLIALHIKEDGIVGLEHIKPTVGIPIRPAAAERMANAREIFEKIGQCIAQPKLDGFRLQIHIDYEPATSPETSENSPKIWFYSRNLQNMSQMFPDLVQALSTLPVKNIIMEGEAIVFDEATNTFLPFQETVKRKRKHDIGEFAQTLPLSLFLFDVLFINDLPVLNKPHSERREILEDVFKGHISSKVSVIDERFCQSVEDLDEYFNEQIAHGLEGLVVKRPNAPYQPGKRNFNWIKLKRVQVGHLADTIDAVVLGYYVGRGRRTEFGVGAFLVGIYDKNKDKFETIAKIGTGLKDQDWKDLKAECDKIAVHEQPHNILCAKELFPDVWVEPKIVVVVLADEITQSPTHTAGRTDSKLGFALRFPRFMGYSLDKLPEQATSIDEIRRLYELQFSKSKE